MYASLARMLKDTLMRLDAVLDRPPYNFMIHTSPIGEEINDHYHWHMGDHTEAHQSCRL